jgi:hypothetical protein
MSNAETKSEKTQSRIKERKSDLRNYRQSLNKLETLHQEQIKIEQAPYAPHKIKYSKIPACSARSQWTIQNIKTEIRVLEAELNALINFGK